METLKNKIMEALGGLTRPMVNNDEVKVIALETNDYIDSNLDLTTGRNRACLIWSPEDDKGYMCANGGRHPPRVDIMTQKPVNNI